MAEKSTDKLGDQHFEDDDWANRYQLLQEQLQVMTAKQEKLMQAQAATEAALTAKSEFLANMSHDLRTPLHAILSYARFGIDKIDKIDKEKIVKYFSNIEESGKKLQEMLNKIVDLSKLEAGKMVFQLHSSNLGLIVQALVTEYAEIPNTKGIEVKTEIPDDLTPVVCDSNRITQVMRTLFQNAVSHAPEGSTVRVSLANRFHTDSESIAGLELCFEDNRADLAPQEAVDDFETFIKKERTKTGITGNGINLSIAYEIVKFHKGGFQVANLPGGGTSYSFTLPVHRSDET